MLQSFTPAITAAKKTSNEQINSCNVSYIASVTKLNIVLNINKIAQQSQLLKQRIENGKLAIRCGIYRIKGGTINWL